MQKCAFLIVITISVLTTFGNKAFAQPAWTTDVLNKEEVKPAKFEDKQLGSEKSAQKKFSRFRHFVQNTITHFNYYYDANNRINLVVEKATFANKDDYTKLLSFYPYSLNSTAAQKKDLDSVILKCTAGILLHDLRNDWIDNMYLLLGKAYFFRKDFDSAEATFQFINYNLFPRKKDEDDNRVVGTNLDASNGTLSIANKEKLNIFQKIASQPPSRNDALVWLARTLVEENNYGDAAGLINTLQFDPNLPPRLQDDVQEVDAYFFFSQGIYDSAANHLERSLTNSTNLEDKARREFLLAQLSEMDHNFAKATFYYNKAASNTNDPLMNIYAQVNNAKMLKTTDPQQLDISINNLLQMVKKDKFDIYRNILYYSAGQLAMQKPDTNAAITYYKKCLENSQTDVSYKNKALVQLGDIVYNRREYKKAFSLYDSLQTGDTSMKETLKNIQDRRNLLSKIVEKLNIIDREDSLQTIAAMPPAERDAFVKRLSRKLNKDKNDSTADNDNDFGLAPIGAGNNNSKPPDLFGSSSSTSSGDWYFYNASLMAQGQTDFKTKWGTRPNSDNWNRKSALDAQKNSGLNNPASMNPDAVDSSTNKDTSASATQNIVQPNDLSFVGLMENLPLTPQKLAASNKLVAENLYELAKIFQDDMQDYGQAIETYNRSLERYPDSLHNGDIYLGLYFCYTKLGNKTKADYYKNLLNTQFANSRAAKILNDPSSLDPNKKDPVVTKQYEDIYNHFIEGSFDEAMDEKNRADSLYGTNYWSPQLLYIEAVYYIKECSDDSTAKKVLKNISTLYPNSPMKAKAERLIDVLNRRKEIERYLTNLKITRATDSETVNTGRVGSPMQQGTVIAKPKPKIDSVKADSTKNQFKRINPSLAVKDSVKKVDTISSSKNLLANGMRPNIIAKKDSIRKVGTIVSGSFKINIDSPHNVIMILTKVDPTYVGEAKNAIDRYNDENFYGQSITSAKDVLDSVHSLLIISSFENATAAMDYYTKLKKAAPDEISWLPSEKYSFLIITDDNLKVLKANKDMTGYKTLLNTAFPNKF